MALLFPHLFSPFSLKGIEIPNRILSTGHDTDLGRHGVPTDALIAYQRARAKGGAGLIVVQVVAVHETARYTAEVLMGTADDCIPHFRKLFHAIRAEGTRVFVQLFHPGRELLWRRDGLIQPSYSASSAPTERFRLVPRELSREMIGEIVEGYGATARRMAEAGAEGVEVVASHGYLPAQFLNQNINERGDQYGGSLDNRLRFMREISASIRRQAPAELILGTRISGDEFDAAGLGEDDTLAICRHLKDEFDYFNVIGGTSASASGAVHIVPPMTVANAYLSALSAKLKQAIGKPVFVAGRINQPQEAERIIAEGAADICGMTRAMISDPDMPLKARQGRIDDIRACIACNQACIGHAQLGFSISCIQHPETGRELEFGAVRRSRHSRRLTVIGGGPGGMKAAAAAAERGNRVTLYEKTARLGGQALMAQLLPHRAEFGGIITNLGREVALAGVEVRLNAEVTRESLSEDKPDAVIIATGSVGRMPALEIGQGIEVVHASDIIAGTRKAGHRVVIYDWLADWIGVGVAEKLASEGSHVTLAVNGVCPAISIQNYVRDAAIARLHRLRVEMRPFMRLYGAENRAAYFIHTAAQEAVVFEDVDTLVVCAPNRPVDGLARDAEELGIKAYLIGDALSPRTAEEAVYEGLVAAVDLSENAR
jgi:2,4-dienoyl-CoA reductase-like NADH-dependent reductase (Old Yellow Enzyme family)